MTSALTTWPPDDAPRPAPGSRWVYRRQSGGADRLTVTGCTERSVTYDLGGRPAGSIRLSTWLQWVGEGRLCPAEGA